MKKIAPAGGCLMGGLTFIFLFTLGFCFDSPDTKNGWKLFGECFIAYLFLMYVVYKCSSYDE